jgi:hypothetical protein
MGQFIWIFDLRYNFCQYKQGVTTCTAYVCTWVDDIYVCVVCVFAYVCICACTYDMFICIYVCICSHGVYVCLYVDV